MVLRTATAPAGPEGVQGCPHGADGGFHLQPGAGAFQLQIFSGAAQFEYRTNFLALDTNISQMIAHAGTVRQQAGCRSIDVLSCKPCALAT